MPYELDSKKVKENAVDYAHVLKTVLQQISAKDRSPESFRAAEILDEAITKAIPDGVLVAHHPHQEAA